MEIKIRKAKKNEIEELVKLNSLFIDYHRKLDNYFRHGSEVRKSYNMYLSRIIKKRNVKILFAEIDKKIVGYLIGEIRKAKPFLVPKRIGNISEAFIKEEYRKEGIGSKMVENLINWFKENKIKNIEVSVNFNNEIGKKAWQKFGFKEFMKKMRMDL